MFDRRSWLNSPLASVAIVVSFVGILVGVPYSYGVGNEKFSIAELLWTSWTQNEDMQHGLLVIPASVVIIYLSRHQFKSIRYGTCHLGMGVLLLGLFSYYAGYRGDIFALGEIGVWLALCGALLWLLGFEAFKILLFPLALLLFAFPIPGIDSFITFPLRIVMSQVSASVLNGLGVPVILSGTGILSAPDPTLGLRAGERFSVDVADPCSGIRSLFALMMVSALYAHFTLKGWWRKWILFLCSIPLAVLGNLFRILMLTFGVIAMGPEKAIGTLEDPSFFHMLAGYVVFAVALGGMIGIGSLLTWVSKLVSGGAVRLKIPELKASVSQGPRSQDGRTEDIY